MNSRSLKARDLIERKKKRRGGRKKLGRKQRRIKSTKGLHVSCQVHLKNERGPENSKGLTEAEKGEVVTKGKAAKRKIRRKPATKKTKLSWDLMFNFGWWSPEAPYPSLVSSNKTEKNVSRGKSPATGRLGLDVSFPPCRLHFFILTRETCRGPCFALKGRWLLSWVVQSGRRTGKKKINRSAATKAGASRRKKTALWRTSVLSRWVLGENISRS